ncbi:ribosome small subunit-dependent GTPase A [Paenibacillus pinisoli]|uniref:Small ribosomal subunit biogenesis GTPase RsgA n=1 Tax=Paenibacillus pinisoli TaxID=1276110 RepID=A0A3A6PJU2_9BACL|nr:ribosome small subunit-dependent GTPase A [Paenibacillus pinisoli]RJX40620.1 ribosome small subunit-dependent GTPase A [Paenibacillus pinisoli]
MTTQLTDYLQAYGWNEQWSNKSDACSEKLGKAAPARVIAQYSHAYKVMSSSGERLANVSGRFEFQAAGKGDFPAVGDWVMADMLDESPPRAVIQAVLPRQSSMARKVAGSIPDEQIIGANMDFLFITLAMNGDFNVRKLERYLIAAWESGATPVVLLTKSDLCEDPERYIAEVEDIAPGVHVHMVSALENQGKDALLSYLKPGRTVAVTGSSGVGKSTLLNWLAEDEWQSTSGIRESDARGRHTTTHRELFLLPSGALMMDTPGMRELQLWDSEEGWQQAFSDIEDLAGRCRFRDCKHEGEAGCAVQAAIHSGELDGGRYSNYKKTERELARLARKENSTLRQRDKKQAASKNSRSRGHKRRSMEDWGE